MHISRRDFLRYCGSAAATLGLTQTQLAALAGALSDPAGPSVLWLQGLGCTGCSVSLLNHLSASAPVDVADLLVNVIDLRFHTTVMASAGQSAAESAYAAYDAGNYILVIEGAVSTAFGGHACTAWEFDGVEVTFQEAVTLLAARATHVVCVGACSAYGGIPARPPNPAGAQSVSTTIGRSTINVAGCPPHPNWIVWTVAQLLAGVQIPLDSYGRPTAIYGQTVHSRCPLRETDEAERFGQPNRCLEELGCWGPETRGDCPDQLFNGGVQWCVGAGALCIGCTRSSFPGSGGLFSHD